jgi:hypothetical protein
VQPPTMASEATRRIRKEPLPFSRNITLKEWPGRRAQADET